MRSLSNRYRIHRRRLLGLLGAPVRSEPVSIDVEPTVRCNLRCAFCQHTTRRRTAPDMTPELFGRILDAFPGLDEIKLQGMGEPLVNRDLPAMVRAAKGRGIRVKTYTNGSLLTEENVAGLVGSGIDEVFAEARRLGAIVVQANHPLIPYGYFANLSAGLVPGGFNPAFDLVEINEAFAVVPIIFMREFGIKTPDKIVTLFESQGGWNASGGPEQLLKHPRHLGGIVVGFADGHAEMVMPDRLDKLVWTPQP
jgi:prepilin-type processing-associated H-X9-DG protein